MKEKLHTCDHILFTILESKFKAKARALQFNDNSCRAVYICDTDLRLLKTELEDSVNKIINKKLEVINYQLTPQEAAKQGLDLFMVPPDCDQINIYEIIGFNKLACIGPHVTNTGEIKKFIILKIDKKGQNCYAITFTVSTN